MKPKTYQILKKSYFQYKDVARLQEIEEDNPFDRFLVQAFQQPSAVAWDTRPFSQCTGSARDRLDETTITFLLHLVAVVYRDKHSRSFLKPESAPVWLAWVGMLKYTTLCVLGLLYRVEWDYEKMQEVDLFVTEILNTGNPERLRRLMGDLGIVLRPELYAAEKQSSELMFLSTHQMGSFYWRLLHWMAEAYALRTQAAALKKTWREFVTHTLHRLLTCQICQYHYRQIVSELQSELLSDETDYPNLWFRIHNKVHANRRALYPTLVLPDYSESEYAKDAEWMRQALE